VSNEDFLANENYILVNFNLQMLNIGQLLYGYARLLNDPLRPPDDGTEEHLFRKEIIHFQVPWLVVILLAYLTFIWRGTRQDLFFSRCNLLTITLLCFVYYAANIAWTLSVINELKRDLGRSFNGFFIQCASLFTVLWLNCSFVYNGKCRSRKKSTGNEDAQSVEMREQTVIDKMQKVV